MSFDEIFIKFSAPTLCGIKSASLFSVSHTEFMPENYVSFAKRLLVRGIRCVYVECPKDRILVLVYNEAWLEKILSDAYVKKYLNGRGYSEKISFLIPQFAEKLSVPCRFPHEIGIVLGYPLEDVIAFEKHGGKNCKYCGCWKCYSDVENAKMCETRYKKCSVMCCKWFGEGCSLHQIIENYKEAALAA